MHSRAAAKRHLDDLDDMALVALGPASATRRPFRLIMQRHNRQLYRVARSVLGE